MAAALVEVELVRVRVPLRHAHVAGHGTESVRDLVLVRVTDADGAVGWGECSALTRPTYTAEHTAGAWLVLRDELAPAALAGRDDEVVGHPMARAALATARLDAHLRGLGRSLAAHLGARVGQPLGAVPTTAVLGRAASIDDLLGAVEARRAEGVAVVKLKVTPRPEDLDAVAAVRRTWPDLPVAVDANGTLDTRSAAILDELGLVYLEQPFPAEELVASAGLARRSVTPIALDESIGSVGALDAAAALGACSVCNVKPARVGGPQEAVDLIVRAAEHDIATFCGGMLETGVGRAAALAVAALPAHRLPTDLGPSSRYLDRDLIDPIELDEAGCLPVPSAPGIGVVPEPGRLEEVAVERLVVRR